MASAYSCCADFLWSEASPLRDTAARLTLLVRKRVLKIRGTFRPQKGASRLGKIQTLFGLVP